MVRRFIEKKIAARAKPDHHVDLKFGSGWHKRNFLAEVVIPSLFTKRHGEKIKPSYPDLREGEICITWIGHASFLVQTPEHSILIDPNWAKWLKVIKRIRQPGLEIHDLPAIDLVLVTHAHFDHLDRKTLRTVASDQAIVVPENVGGLVHGLGFKQVRELRQWESFEMGSLKVTLTPARHWGARVLHDSHRGFGGFHIEYGGRTVFHCGDSAWFEGFTEIGERLPVEIALLPIGAYEAPTKRDVHMNPEQAIDAFLQLKARTLVPMHFGTFRLSYEPLHEPPERLIRHGAAKQIIDRIRILNEGEPTVF
jgi:L-ascorbate metabolism protein UlaG (beta-lactamase superfamily)